jgi:hypothetical protein
MSKGVGVIDMCLPWSCMFLASKRVRAFRRLEIYPGLMIALPQRTSKNTGISAEKARPVQAKEKEEMPDLVMMMMTATTRTELKNQAEKEMSLKASSTKVRRRAMMMTRRREKKTKTSMMKRKRSNIKECLLQ